MTQPDTHAPGEACLTCASRFSQLRKLGLRVTVLEAGADVGAHAFMLAHGAG